MNMSQRISENNYIFLEKDENYLNFFKYSNDKLIKLNKLHIEWSYIIDKFIKSDIPSEAEIESSINYIEDALMDDLSLVNSNDLNLYTDDDELKNILVVDEKKLEFTKDDIEREFTKYALLSMGRSPVLSDVEMDQKKYIALLVVREILNHLKFSSIRFITP